MTLPRSIRVSTALALASGALAMGAPSAGAAILSPPVTDFGGQRVGTKSPVRTLTLTVQCQVSMGICVSADVVNTSEMSASGDDKMWMRAPSAAAELRTVLRANRSATA